MKQFYPSVTDGKDRFTFRKIVLMFLVFFVSGSFMMMTGQTVTTDKFDYQPGETVIITGTGWQPGETVSILIDHLTFDHPDETLTTTANSLGVIYTDEYSIEEWDLGETFLLTATGMTSGLIATTTFTDGGGAYSINLQAADPELNSAPYLPTYDKLPPALLPCTAGGRASNPLPDAVFNSLTGQDDAVESLAPENMALCQIVPFFFKVTVGGSTEPEGGVISLRADWNTRTTNGENFGYDPAYGLYCAFVDYGEYGTVDPGNDATVDGFSWVILEPGTSNERIQGTINVSGLDNGDIIFVEAWVVLKCEIPAGTGGNVQTSLQNGYTGIDPNTGETIKTGNQTVPLLRVGEFFTSDVDLNITKADSPDPYTFCQSDLVNTPLNYTITVSNAGPAIANTVVVTDNLDSDIASIVDGSIHINSNMTGDLSGIWGVDLTAFPNISFGSVDDKTVSLMMLEEVTIEFDVILKPGASYSGTGGAGGYGPCPAGNNYDLCNFVSVSTISDDIVASNNSYYQPTDLVCETVPPVFTGCPDSPLVFGCNTTQGPTCTDALALVTASDVCGGSITPTCSAGTITEDGCSKTQTFTLTATDLCGNTATCEITYIWTVDNEAPVITAINDITVEGCNTAWPAAPTTTFTDACTTPYTLTGVPGEVQDDGCYQYIIYTFNVTDDCGNAADPVTVKVTRKYDVTDPVIECSRDIVTCEGESVTVAEPRVSDNCDTDLTVNWTRSDDATGFNDPFGVGITTVTFTAEDDCGNDASCTVTVTVNPKPDLTDVTANFCQDDVASFNTADYNDAILDEGQSVAEFSFAWSGGPLNVPTDEAHPSVQTVYNVIVTNRLTGCSDEATLTVNVAFCSELNITKLTENAVNTTSANSWTFQIYKIPEGFGSTPIASVTATIDGNGYVTGLFDNKLLNYYESYAVCELEVPAGWGTTWQIDTDGDFVPDTYVMPYNPDYDPSPSLSADLGNRCFNIGAGTSYPLLTSDWGKAINPLVISVMNRYPGGEPRTPGYWKNWNTCTGGGQSITAALNGGPAAGWFILDDILTEPGIQWGPLTEGGYSFSVLTCEDGVKVLDQRELTDAATKHSNDAAYSLAMHLMTYQLNQAAGAYICPAMICIESEAIALLIKYRFNGTGIYLVGNSKSKTVKADYSRALWLASVLDAYNNGLRNETYTDPCDYLVNMFKLSADCAGTPVVDPPIVPEEPIAVTSLTVFPNPFFTSTTISFDLNVATNVHLEIRSNIGILLETLLKADCIAGHYDVQWDASTLKQGTYYYKLTTGTGQVLSGTIVKKVKR